MSESRRPHVSNRRLILLAGFLLIAAFAGFVHIRTRQIPPVELFLHEDGTLSEGERTGKRIRPDQIDLSPFDEGNPFRSKKVILDAPPGTPLIAWNATFEGLAMVGINAFELRLGPETLDFHLPALDGDRHLTRDADPLVMIDLRMDPSADYRRGNSNPDILVLADDSTTVDRFLEASKPHRKSGVSLMVRRGNPQDAEVPMMIQARDERASIGSRATPWFQGSAWRSGSIDGQRFTCRQKRSG
jgi:hypothetical protein